MAQKQLVLSLVLLGALCGCNARKGDFRQAAEVHRQGIAYVAAFARFVQPPRGEPTSAYYYAARTARVEIMKQALIAADQRPLGVLAGRALRPVERIGQAFATLMPHCALTDPRDSPAEQRKTAECWAAIQDLDGALMHEDLLAQQAGLKSGTIPHISMDAITKEAQAATAQLLQSLAPVPAELQRRRLWVDPDASEQALEAACEAVMREAKHRPPGVYEEVAGPCMLFREVGKNLSQVFSCSPGKTDCLNPSVCGAIQATEKRLEDLPAMYQDRMLTAIGRCQLPGAAPPAQERPAQARPAQEQPDGGTRAGPDGGTQEAAAPEPADTP